MKKNINPITLFVNACKSVGRSVHNLFFNDTREFEKLKNFLTT